MATPWWAKVTPDYYKKPSGLGADIDQRSRHYAAVLADTHLADEPQLAAAFLNANVPYSTAQRINRQYQMVKNQAATNVMNKAGMPMAVGTQVTPGTKPTGPPAVPVPPEKTDSIWGNASNPWDAFVNMNTQLFDQANNWAASVPGVPTLDTAMQGLRSVPKALMTGMNAAFSPVQVPISTTLANMRGAADTQGVHQDVSNSMGGGFLGDLAGGAANLAVPFITGVGSNLSPALMAPGQTADMTRAGYDPNSWASRYAWYYDAMETGQRAVSENDISRLSQQYDPEKVQAAREVITSNFLNDNKLDALSPAAQAYVTGIHEGSADPKDVELFTQMSHAAGTRPGGVVSALLGQDVGSEASQFTAALGDLAFYWFADPVAGGAKAIAAMRLQRMVPAGSKAALENSIVAVKEPGNIYSEAATPLGRNMNDLLTSVEDVHHLVAKAHGTTATEEQAQALNQAARIYGQFAIKHPDMVDQWAFVAQVKSGKVEFIKPKSDAEMEIAKQKAIDGKGEFEPWWLKVNDKPSKPGYVLDRSSPEEFNRSLNEARADITSRMSEWMFFNAWKQGNPIIKGMLLMPGEVAVNARVRAAIAPVRDRLMGSEGRILDYLTDVKAQRAAEDVHFDGSLDRLGTLFLGKQSGEWIKANYTQKWSATLEKIASNFGMTYSNKPVVFAAPESLKTFQRMGLAHMPRRMAQVVAIDYARSGPAERRMMLEQWQNMLAEAANFKNTPLAREVYNVLTKGEAPRPGQANPYTYNPGEVYTANRADNEIKVGESKVAAGIWDYQMADRMQAPNYRVIQAMQQRTGLLSAVTGLFNARVLNGPTAIWKVGKVGNPANMGRQAIEAYTLLLADQGFGAFIGALNARRGVANATVEERLEKNTLTRAANKVVNETRGKPTLAREIGSLGRSGDVVAYRAKLAELARNAGFKDDEINALATLAEGVKVEDLARLTPWGKTATAMAGVLTPLRRLRLTVANNATGGTVRDVVRQAEWHTEQDKAYIEALTNYALGRFGHASDDAISLTGGSVAQEMASGARLGVPSRPAQLPNARDWLGTAGDGGAINWFRELDSRQVDQVGNEVLRAVAIQARHDKAGAVAESGTEAVAKTQPVPHVEAERPAEPAPQNLDDLDDLDDLDELLPPQPASQRYQAQPGEDLDELDDVDDFYDMADDLLPPIQARPGGRREPATTPVAPVTPPAARVTPPVAQPAHVPDVEPVRHIDTPTGDGTATIAQILNQARKGKGEQIPEQLDNVYDIARWLVRESENGTGLRNLADHLAYDQFGGRITAGSPGMPAWDDAVDRLVEIQVRDAALHLGGKEKPAGGYEFPAEYNAMLDKLGYGRRVTLDDLSKIKDDIRPKELSASVYVPDLVKPSKRNIVDLASKLYSFTVARPLQRLAINPVYLANKNIAYREMAPVADELMASGLSAKQTSALLEQASNNYAIATTFRYTDNVYERSFFSEITENFLMFQRASEDFLRRFSMVVKANPQILSRAYLLMEAANHSGLIYPGPPQDDDGDGSDPTQHLMFTFPGSGLMAQAIQEVGQALGWGDSGLVTKPLFSSMSSQVRYVNPSLSNPFGFSTTPLIGMPLRVMRQIFPESDAEITNTLGRLEGGGERFFAEQSIGQSLLPTPLARLAPALGETVGGFILGADPNKDGQLASAVRNAFVYFGAAGLLPTDNATDEEVEEAHQTIKDMATNQLIWRAAVGTFSPWAPQFNAPQGTGLPEVNVLDQARGIKDLRGEWFDVIRQAAEKVGGEAAMGEASAEWLRRHPDGLSIINPTAFATGTTDNPGNAGHASNVASGPALTEWMVANKQWLKDNQTVAYYLLPNYLEPQYTAQGMRDQLRNGVRVHRDGLDFYKEMRYQIATRTYWAMVNRKSALIASGADKTAVNKQFKQWETDWKTTNPATAAEKARREDPAWVKGTLAPSLERMVTSGKAPAGVDLDAARKVWDHYSQYEAQYNKTPAGNKGQDKRYNLNEQYRDQGDRLFLGTPAHDLWKAMDIYENGY